MKISVGKIPNSTHFCGRSKSYKPAYGKDLSILGNPYYMPNEFHRDKVCDKYDKYFDKKVLSDDSEFKDALSIIIDDVKSGESVVLGCFCHPKRCHVDTIKRYIEKILNGGS